MSFITFILVSTLQYAFAMRGESTYDIEGWGFGRWVSFSAYAGATFQQTIQLNGQPPSPLPWNGAFLWSIIADSDQFNQLINMDQDVICASNVTTLTLAAGQIGFSGVNGTQFAKNWGVTVTAPYDDTYSFLFLSCTPVDLQATFDYHLVNPGGEELSAGYIPLKPLSLAFCILWPTAAIASLIYIFYQKFRWNTAFRTQYTAALSHGTDAAVDVLSPVRKLHWSFLATPLLFFVNATLARAFYLNASETGVFDSTLAICAAIVAALATAAILTVILLVARGWQVTRLPLDSSEKRQVSFMLIAYLVVFAGWEIAGGLFFLFVLIMVYVVMFRYIFAELTWRLTLLRGFRRYVTTLFHPPQPASSSFDHNTVYIASNANESDGLIPPTQSNNIPEQSPGTRPAITSQATYGAAEPTLPPESSQSEAGNLAGEQSVPSGGVFGWMRRSQYALLGNPRLVPDGTLTLRQIAAFKHFRSAIVAYICVIVLLQIWRVLALWAAPWAAYMATELLHLLMFMYLFWLFRPRANPSTNVLFDPHGYTGNFDRLLDRQEPLPSTTSVGSTVTTPRFFVIQNPDSVDANGKVVQSMAIAEMAGAHNDVARDEEMHDEHDHDHERYTMVDMSGRQPR